MHPTLQKTKGISRKTWEGIKAIINTKNPSYSAISQLKVKGEIIHNPEDISNTFNTFFTDIGPNTNKIIPKNPVDKPEKFLRERNPFEFLIAHTSNEEILEIISQLENKSTGPQSIPIKLLKIIPDLILVPLCRIISTSFMTGIFPDALKISKVIPVHKDGPADNVNNYRPISLLSIFDKIIEKMMHKRLSSFLEQHNILFKNQFGFRKNNSTTFALLDLTERIKESIENKKYGCGIFIDLRKAFDTVNHEILLKKLEHYGIRGIALKWFNSYLSNRKQYVYVNGVPSSLLDIKCGVPQGSVLGPLLFLIYINDLPNISNSFDFFLFADDTNIYHEAETIEKLEGELNKGLRGLHNWLIVNRLSLNISKTNFVVFHPYNKPIKQNITLKIKRKAISEKNNVKYLGILVDNGLTWKAQIDSISKKVSRAIGVLYKIRPYVNTSILKTLYYSLIYSHFNYAIEIWGSADTTHLNTLQLQQKRVIRLINRSDRRLDDFSFQSIDKMYHKLGFMKISDIFILRLSLFIFKALNCSTPANFHSWFTLISTIHSYNTRSKFLNIDNSELTRTLFIFRARTTHYGLKSTKILGAKVWNNLPPSIRVAEKSLISFKRELRNILLDQYTQ